MMNHLLGPSCKPLGSSSDEENRHHEIEIFLGFLGENKFSLTSSVN